MNQPIYVRGADGQITQINQPPRIVPVQPIAPVIQGLNMEQIQPIYRPFPTINHLNVAPVPQANFAQRYDFGQQYNQAPAPVIKDLGVEPVPQIKIAPLQPLKVAPLQPLKIAPLQPLNIAPQVNIIPTKLPTIIPQANVTPAKAPTPDVQPITPATKPDIKPAGQFSIMCFSWNASGLRLCETMSQLRADEARAGLRSYITRKPPCIVPDFFEEIRHEITTRRPSLVVMTTQDEDSNGTYFHAELLPNALPEINYSLLKRNVLTGIGETASGVKLTNVPSGEPGGSALRISIYAHNSIIKSLREMEENINGQVESTCDQGSKMSGAIASYVWHPVYGKFAFIAVHIPAGVNTLTGKRENYLAHRTKNKAGNIICLLKIYEELVISLPDELRPDHLFLLGDMNYDIVLHSKDAQAAIKEISDNVSAAKLKELQRYDEMRWDMNSYPLYGFKEGVAGEGPLFMPTWNLERGRPSSCAPGKTSTQVDPKCFSKSIDPLITIGWHDRILYKEFMTSKYMSHCIDYNRLDLDNMRQSTHAGVTAFFELRPIH